MKTHSYTRWLFCAALAGSLLLGRAQTLSVQQLANHGLPVSSARETLPAVGAVVHLQVHDFLGTLEEIEQVLVSGIPEKAVPPDLQGLLQSEHPLLTLVGMQNFQEPVTRESFERFTGIDPRGTLGLTLYFGDPRRMFILSVPSRSREPLVALLNGMLQPSVAEPISLGDRTAVRLVTDKLRFTSELFLLASEDTVYVCGDRSLAIALFNTPEAQRMGQDGFLSRVIPAQEDQEVRLVLNPAAIKPFAMQLQGMRGLGTLLIHQQRTQILAGLPAEAREQFEMQVRTQLGVDNLEQFADYAECVLGATLEQVVDFLTGGVVAFEGLTLTSDMADGVRQFDVKVYSQKYKLGDNTAPLPMNEVRQALAWLGPEYQCFSVTGRKPAPKDLPIVAAWSQRVRQQLDAKGLRSSALERLAELLENRAPIPTVESQAPWTLTTYAPLQPAPSLADAPSLEAYFVSLELPVNRPVRLVPGRDLTFLENCYRSETEARNRNRTLTFDFFNSFQPQKPWIEQVNRFQSATLDQGVRQLVRESAWVSRSGFFGYDQHELVSRKIVWARQVGDYLVSYHGVKESPWLAQLRGSSPAGLAPAVTRFLDAVPEGANSVSVHRVLVGLPNWAAWVGELESRLHRDVQTYLQEAQAIVQDTADLEAAKNKIRGLRMPELIGSVNLNPVTREVYALLPTGNAPFVLPRPPVVPLLQELLADYARQADSVGGSMVYTRVNGEVFEMNFRQSWNALTTLTRTFGNALFETYLATPEKQQGLQRKLATARDWDAAVFDEVIARNPQWAFIPQPQPKTDARPTAPIPARATAADARMIDLTEYYNGALTTTWHQGGLANNTLKDLPRGLQDFGGTTFDVRGIVQLSGTEAVNALSVRFPQQVDGIPVNQKAQRLQFLHACGWPSAAGTTVGKYVLHYANGETREIPIRYGQDVQDWWMNDPITPNSGIEVAWQGRNNASPNGPSVGVYKTSWSNPLPDVEIRSIDYASTMAPSAPFLIAITVE